tara:strand:- start:46 stop:972 length:927 start_codon:yes stop_codon:yes gene_type:complete
MESWGYSLNEKKTKKGFGEGTPPKGEWYDKKVIVMEDGSLDHPGMCCADAHSGQDHGAWATAQQQGRTEAPAIVSLEEGVFGDIGKGIRDTARGLGFDKKGAIVDELRGNLSAAIDDLNNLGLPAAQDTIESLHRLLAKSPAVTKTPEAAKYLQQLDAWDKNQARQDREQVDWYEGFRLIAHIASFVDPRGDGNAFDMAEEAASIVRNLQQGPTASGHLAEDKGKLPPWLDKKKKDDDDSGAEASSDDDDDDIVPEKEDDPGVENERKKRDEPRNYVGRPGHVQNPLHEHEELVNRVVERVVARLQKS